MKPEFTDEENFVIAYYRDEKASSIVRLNLYDGIKGLIAIGFFVYGLVRGDFVWTIVAFGILLFTEVKRMLGTSKYVRVIRSIFAKYDDALTAESKSKRNAESENSSGDGAGD